MGGSTTGFRIGDDRAADDHARRCTQPLNEASGQQDTDGGREGGKDTRGDERHRTNEQWPTPPHCVRHRPEGQLPRGKPEQERDGDVAMRRSTHLITYPLIAIN
ncbi:hypothetical protein GCM10010174_18620 [Kutzneria viridogrisea]|uniref:Uncharacterized protein n=1 Tax=Kutzneria viridogrisea TaxID=47990 RepID=A0ABR6B809_9PSEU|nr:hypothetical protein [Kutzneria viridogrisea]